MLLTFHILNTCNTSRFQDLPITLHISLNYLLIFQFHYLYIFLFLFCLFFCCKSSKPLSYRCTSVPHPPVPMPFTKQRIALGLAHQPADPMARKVGNFREGLHPHMNNYGMILWFHFFIPILFGLAPQFFVGEISKSEVDGLFLFHLSLFSENLQWMKKNRFATTILPPYFSFYFLQRNVNWKVGWLVI